MIPNLLQKLAELADRDLPCPFTGCLRKNIWTDKVWRDVRGEALLSTLGQRVMVDTPVGSYTACLYDTYLLAFRGGKWKSWWREDLQTVHALTSKYGSPCNGTIVLQELDGRLSQVYIEPPSQAESEQLVLNALDAWKNQSRISKSGPRAYLCNFCQVKRRCDAFDLDVGQTQDWPKDYQVG
jgi:hypothetical protein